MTSKLFSLVGGVATGLVITMAVVIPMPGRQTPVLTTVAEPVPMSKEIEGKELSDLTPTVAQSITQPAVPCQQEQPVQIAPAPVLTLQLETPLPDQTGRNLALQQQTRPVEPNRVTHQLAQAWEPGVTYTPRYLPHNQGNRRPDPGQPAFTNKDGRNPRPPEAPEPASFGN